MTQNDDWTHDPVVRFENAVLPVLWQGYRIICDALVSAQPEEKAQDLVVFDTAIEMLRRDAIEMLTQRGIRPSGEDAKTLQQAADAVADLRGSLQLAIQAPMGKEQAQALMTRNLSIVAPTVQAALDAFRKVFIGHMMEQQTLQARQATEAIRGLDRISKQIFFISINASVEAARAGEAGRGFTQISADIRALSQSAQGATRDFTDLVRSKEEVA